MKRLIQTVGIIGFFLCLAIMYVTPYGIRGIQVYDPTFQLPDMKFHYSAEQITHTLEQIGNEGRTIYQKYFLLDSVFLLCFLIVMATITFLLFTGSTTRKLLLAVCILRAIFDVLENSFMIIIVKSYPAINKTMIMICSYFTTIKFVLLYTWTLVIIIQLGLLGFQKLRGNG